MEKRSDYISWHDFFMYTAILASKRSKDPVTQVGACVVNKNNHIVGVGYNGLPLGTSDDTYGIWDKEDKHFHVCHAEMNAIVNSTFCGNNMEYTMYVTLFPCNECAKIIINSRKISTIYYKEMKNTPKYEMSILMLNNAGIKFICYNVISPLTLL